MSVPTRRGDFASALFRRSGESGRRIAVIGIQKSERVIGVPQQIPARSQHGLARVHVAGDELLQEYFAEIITEVIPDRRFGGDDGARAPRNENARNRKL